MTLAAPQRQQFNEVMGLLRDLAQYCPHLANVLNYIADALQRAEETNRIDVVAPGTGSLGFGERAITHVEWKFLTGRYMQTTLAATLFGGRNLNRLVCSDILAIVTLLATLTHEYYHRRCDVDPLVYDLNIAMLTEIKNCINPDRPCAAELKAALESEIAAETAARGPGGQGSETVKTALVTVGIGALAGALSMKLGLTAAIAGGVKTGGTVGAAGGPIGVGAGVGIGIVASVGAYFWYHACE